MSRQSLSSQLAGRHCTHVPEIEAPLRVLAWHGNVKYSSDMSPAQLDYISMYWPTVTKYSTELLCPAISALPSCWAGLNRVATLVAIINSLYYYTGLSSGPKLPMVSQCIATPDD